MKKEIVNKRVPVEMLIDTAMGPRTVQGIAIITNDRHGKTQPYLWQSADGNCI